MRPSSLWLSLHFLHHVPPPPSFALYFSWCSLCFQGGVSHPRYYWHLGQASFCSGDCFVTRQKPGTLPSPQPRQPKRSPDVTKCPMEIKSSLVDTPVLTSFIPYSLCETLPHPRCLPIPFPHCKAFPVFSRKNKKLIAFSSVFSGPFICIFLLAFTSFIITYLSTRLGAYWVNLLANLFIPSI